MDISSKEDKFVKLISKTKKIRNIIYILLAIISLIILFVVPNKTTGWIIVTSILTLIIITANFVNECKDMMIFHMIHEISKSSEDIVDIFEKTKETSEIEPMLNKSHKKILEYLYKIEKHIHNSTLKVIQSENLSNEIVVEVSKNLKSPVNKIVNLIDELKSKDLKDNLEVETIDKIDEESSILKHRIEELFELSKVVTGSVDLSMQKIDIANLLKQALAEYEDDLHNNKLNLKTNITESKLFINCDGQQMWRVFEILLDNIIKYSKVNSRVYSELYREDNEIVMNIINISDKELNIDKNQFLKIIKEDSEAKKMGIAIASNLVKIQNGKFDIIIDGDMFKIEIRFDEADSIS